MACCTCAWAWSAWAEDSALLYSWRCAGVAIRLNWARSASCSACAALIALSWPGPSWAAPTRSGVRAEVRMACSCDTSSLVAEMSPTTRTVSASAASLLPAAISSSSAISWLIVDAYSWITVSEGICEAGRDAAQRGQPVDGGDRAAGFLLGQRREGRADAAGQAAHPGGQPVGGAVVLREHGQFGRGRAVGRAAAAALRAHRDVPDGVLALLSAAPAPGW